MKSPQTFDLRVYKFYQQHRIRSLDDALYIESLIKEIENQYKCLHEEMENEGTTA